MNNKAQFTPLKKAVHVIPMLYAEAFAGSNNKEFIMELYEDARLLETAAPAMYEALQATLAYFMRSNQSHDAPEEQAIRTALAQAEGEGILP